MTNDSKRAWVSRFFLCVCLATTCIFASGCSQPRPTTFDPRECLEIIPKRVEGLKVIQGPRTELSLIADMRSAVCNGQVLFNLLRAQGEPLHAGLILVRVRVEYTGEPIAVEVLETTVSSETLADRVSDFIMDSDFIPWARHEKDTIFDYPIYFEVY
ncbi:hypothetical protein SAMN05660860_02728 [Geoalkalibacter ferrihydriticus]|uniref:TonB C-terminal domain-containing protein n=2 Tax=Geoalkalibacter ferrihydriticus TaxID=392333 RepID=A0A0C2DR47_9BACT|nr:hypothetical protein [Geoalkalibacter ferrihydriticus]KIH75914.1 hypothetical protein GFER_13430 [Geoalkalibacter ferrihydriticus DSM 17813]SDM55117.1 hypothetical protein SAMN05660860_02728 [Geoalkalibacter ferrihydriticus]